MASSSRAVQTSYTPQLISFHRTPGDFPTDPTPPPVSKETSFMFIEEGDEIIERKCRATRDGSKAKDPFVELTAWDSCGNLPGRDSIRMELPITAASNKRFDTWIDPHTRLGNLFWLRFERARGSMLNHVARMWEFEESKSKPTVQLELRPKPLEPENP